MKFIERNAILDGFNIIVFITIFLILALLSGCAGLKQGVSTKQWTQPLYDLCSPNVVADNLPYDIGVTIYNTHLPTRYDSFSSMRPYIISKTGEDKNIGEVLNEIPFQTMIAFSNWSINGRFVYINRIWEQPENAMWEQAAKQLLLSEAAYRGDVFIYDTQTEQFENLTAPESVSYYNVGASEIPNTDRLAFSSIINGSMKGFSMNKDGSDKQPMQSTGGFTYGIITSPDGTKYAFNSNYKLFIGDVATGAEQQIPTGCIFNFLPSWSEDSQTLSFFCGPDSNGPDIYLVNSDGSNVRKLTDRGGYSGSVSIIDGYDFHNGSSDNVTWYGENIIYASAANGGTELFSINSLTGLKTRLTYSDFGTLNYYPKISPDGKYLLFNTNLNNLRNLNYLNLQTLEAFKITNVLPGCGILTNSFRPE